VNAGRHARRGWRRIARALALLLALVLFAPLPVILLLNVIQPPTTSLIMQRAVQRLAGGQRPVYPRREIVGREEISPHLRRAVLASEDDRFYLHHGFDLEEMRKALERRRAGGRLRGASTLTQQVAKNVFLWNGRSLVRKGYEAWLTVWFELLLPKDRIVDLYLNLAEWGDGIFGAEAAAQAHFGKSARRLTREESARLAAILPSPLRWPATGTVATRRMAAILQRMQYPAPRR
jgi:monofunctional glycosyltransferase